jgi:hypothetical protein
MDCTSADGTAFIGYAGAVRWKNVHFSHSGIIDFTGTKAEYMVSFSDTAEPETVSGQIIRKPDSLSCALILFTAM